MTNKLLPRIIDNSYGGSRIALWLLGALVLMKGVMGINSMFIGRVIAVKADGIPLDSFGDAGAQAVLAFLAVWGLSLLILSLLGVLALVRYRAMVPLVFLLLLVEHLGRKLILVFIPIAKTGAPPALSINAVLLGLTAIGLVLSLWGGRKQDGGVS